MRDKPSAGLPSAELLLLARASLRKRGGKDPQRTRRSTTRRRKPEISATLRVVGGRFAEFELGRRLGGGAFGEVHAAYDRVQKARVALKRLRYATALDLYRFKKEFRALADISHPNLVRLHELFEDDAQWYIAMELVDGVDIVSFARLDPLLALAPTVLAPVAHDADGAVPEDVNVDRLRACFTQLAAGVEALHVAKRVHRDLKPSNVLVDPNGTVKILDFGLVTELTDASASLAQMVGTPAYMAPEQGRGDEVTPAADWYAVGVLLYETLLGRVPFDGAPMAVLAAKQTKEPIHPRTREGTLPEDLCGLCMQLLQRDPRCRPAGAEVFDLLSATGRPARRISSPSPKTHLIGRQSELKSLRDAFEDSRRGAVVVHVTGPSGNGKTSLLRAFVEGLCGGGGADVFEGRCYEGEGVPFKAVDTVMDATAARLVRAPASEIERLLPRDFESLTRLFPVLKRLVTSSRQRSSTRELHDPIEIRRRGFAALRDLVGRIAERRHVVVCIDDFQWGDLDSVALLADLVRPPDAPPLLLVLSYRSEQSEASAVLRALRENVSGERPVTIDVGPLTHEESVTLAHAILDPQGTAAEGDFDAIARESGGSPLFVKELARHVSDGALSTDDVSIDDLIARRLERLPNEPRAMLEVIAIAASAAPLRLIRGVAGSSGEVALSSLAVLKSEHLVRARHEGEEEVIEAYHDRIRERVRALLAPERARRWHGLLAAALEANEDADPETIAIHYHASHTPERAQPHAERAALAASAALAFDRAAQWYELALGLTPAEHTSRRELQIKLGDALANAGRGPLAARSYQQAAEGAAAATSLELRRRSSEQLLRAGLLDEGLDAIRSLLATVGMRLPRTPMMGLLYFLLLRFFLWIRGLGFKQRDTSEISAKDLERLDICWNIATSLGTVDPFRASAFQAKHLVLALRAGEPFRVSRAIAVESVYASLGGERTWRRAETLIARAQSLAEATNRRDAIAYAIFTRGFANHLAGHCKAALHYFEEALGRLRDECSGMYWEIGTAQAQILTNLWWTGALKELCARQPIYLRQAVDRGDLYTAFNLRTGHRSFAYLASDDPELAHSQVATATREWSSKEGFHVEHLDALMATVNAHLYSGDGEQGYAAVTRQWPALVRSLLTRIQLARILVHWDRARSALAVAELDRKRAAPFLSRAESDARVLARERSPLAPSLGKLVEAGVANVRGDGADRVRDLLAAAIAGFGASDLALHEMSARRCLGLVIAGDEGKTLVASVDAWLVGETVRNPARLAATIAPGFRR